MTHRLLLLLGLISMLAGCFHAQLNGSIAGAQIDIRTLREPGLVVTSTTSIDESGAIDLYSGESWAQWNAIVRHALLGIFTIDATVIDADTLYLVTARGGFETDMNRDQQIDENLTPVSHDWRAIMTGAQLLATGYKVSALTEAAYRWVEPDLDLLSDAALLQRLDTAAAGLVNDGNDDGAVDYGDLLYWSRILFTPDSFKGDFERLNELSLALVVGSTDTSLNSLAAIIMESGASSSFWRQLAADLDDGTFASADFLYAAQPDPDFCIAGALSQAAKDRVLEVINQIRALHNLPAVSYSSFYDQSVQESALIQTANNYLSHFPMSGDRCYTEAGAQASASGNLSGASRITDPAADMIGHIDDSRNLALLAAAGHRRSTLNPFMAYTAYGQVDGRSAQKVFSFDAEPLPAADIQVDYVAFPYQTYPYLFFSTDPSFPTPWSFTVIEDKNSLWGNQHTYFSNTSIVVSRLSDGTRLAITDHYNDTSGFGVPNFLSWEVPDWAYDTRYVVEISNVEMLSGETRDYRYEVFIDYADLVDLAQPLEAGDGQAGSHLEGSLAAGDDRDRDSYVLELEGSVTVSASSQYSNQAFYVLLYGPDKQLVRGEDSDFKVTLEKGSYTVVISACKGNRCWDVNVPTQYQVDFM